MTNMECQQEVERLSAEIVKVMGLMGNSRQLSLAKTKLEEAVMWTEQHVKKVTRDAGA